MSAQTDNPETLVVLLPCPFCGSADIDAHGWASEHATGPACDDCGASAGGVSAAHADNVAAWNQRSKATPGDPPADDDWHLRGYAYASKQATKCAQCGEHKHTPLRIDAMDGYVCLTCIDKKLGELLGEFGYDAPGDAEAVAAVIDVASYPDSFTGIKWIGTPPPVGTKLYTHPAPPVVAELPLDDDTRQILGTLCFQAIHTARLMRANGIDVPKRAEDEQAAAIHWMLNHYFRHGKDWRTHAQADVTMWAAAQAKGATP